MEKKDGFVLACCQIKGGYADKQKSVAAAEDALRRAASGGADMAVLPEMWDCPYENRFFFEYGEPEGGPVFTKMSALARELGMYIVAGSIPETEDGRVYNTCFVFGRDGEFLAKHRKVHLFDIDVPGQICFKESDTFSPGEQITTFDTEYCKVGVGICYDIRFPEMFRKMTLDGCLLAVLPGAFNMTTGPAHWEMSVRMRALDNQMYVAGCAPARDHDAFYRAFGNSCVADPWGTVVAKTNENPGVIFADIDFAQIRKIREQLPLLKHRRPEIY